MSAAISILFGVMLLTTPEERIDREAAAAISEDAERVELAPGARPKREAPKSAHVRSRTSDYDRAEGVIMYEGDVTVVYSEDCTMCSDRLFMFTGGSNELTRVVALGHVTITNELRSGACEMAVYRRRKSEIEMFGDAKTGKLATLSAGGIGASTVEGSRIRFWLDSEQVEVDNSSIKTEQKGAKLL